MKFVTFIIILYSLVHDEYAETRLLQTVTYKFQEESSLGKFIVNIGKLHSYFTEAEYFITSHFFKISNTGDLILISRIDLETICPTYKLCCEMRECVVETKVIARDKSSDQSICVIIRIIFFDINDNWPRFFEPYKVIRVPANISIGSFICLEPAYDADVDPNNQITEYFFEEPTGTFKLDQKKLPSIRLIVQKQLDYNVKSVFSASLKACDVGKQCNTQTLKIHVQVNDLVFLQKHYQMEILENFTVDCEILQVQAVYKNSKKSDEILYRFYLSDNIIKDTFRISRNTGSIKLKRKLSAKFRQKYKFRVHAVYLMDPMLPKAVANVSITVKDINDNSSVIVTIFGNSKGEINKKAIIIVAVGITSLFLFVIIVSILCVRRKPRNNANNKRRSQNRIKRSERTWTHDDEIVYLPPPNVLYDCTSLPYLPNEIESSVPMSTFVSTTNLHFPSMNYQNVDFSRVIQR